jgi:hypothetical protein
VAVPVLRTHFNAVKTALAALGVTVGDAEAPTVAPPHVALYQIDGGGLSGTLEDPNDDAELIYQATCTGVSREQTQWLVDKTFGLLAGVAITGRSVPLVQLEMMPGVKRDDNVSPPIFWATPRFRLFSTPS